MGPDPTASACEAELKRLKKYDYVLLSLHPSVTQKADTLSDAVRRLLSQLNHETRLVVSHFGNVNALSELDTLDCVLAAYDDRVITQQAVGQMIWGGLTGNGRLPLQIGEMFCAGDGLKCGKPIRLEYVEPEVLGITPQSMARIDSVVNTAIWSGAFPGCQILAVKNGRVFLNKSYGFHDYDHTRRVRNDDLYDIASITKIASTTLLAMQAYEEDTLKLLMPLRYYLEELDSNFVTIKDITITELMIHQAGLPPGLPVYKYYTMIDSVDSLRSRMYSSRRDDTLFTVQIAEDLYFNRNYLDTIWNRVRLIPLNPVKEYKYSDVSMFLMKAVLERIYGKGLDTLVQNRFYHPLGLQTACYHPADRFNVERLVPTERDVWWRKKQLKGYVHDHSTALFGGVGGQAGVFSDARDLAIIMQMLLNGGTYGGKRYFKQSTVERFTSRQPGSHRGLGFDMQRPAPIPGKGYNCISASPRTFGHFGFTGTCVWADPENDVIYVMLTNRVYPKANNWTINSLRVRQSVQQAVYDALGLMEMYCEDVEMPIDSIVIDALLSDSLVVDSALDGV
jgi:CubicO group peptidase (beta-lactamase class C family)